MRLLLIAMSMVAITANEAHALSYSTYVASREDELGKVVLRSIGSGIEWANVQAGVTLGKQLYCPPENVVLNESNYDQIMTDFVHDNTDYGDGEVELALLHALMETFPC
ncbi:hypothetical protein A3840_02830 [Devosia elaeis]|uniref:Rap1a immunity protein domain-containing protein n=1 Tax=Devosia elaeis TaxID=1770058 RepID=A0A178I552_9HYPH|nr:hypothetical protein A3840_02830 [Devosia elaeis]